MLTFQEFSVNFATSSLFPDSTTWITRFLSKQFCLQPFSQRFCFFTVCVVHFLREMASWWASKGKLLKFKSPDHLKMYFSWIFFFFFFFFFFFEFQSLMGSFKENLTRNIHSTFLYACL